jgi:linoleoyl-CoA desaturase
VQPFVGTLTDADSPLMYKAVAFIGAAVAAYVWLVFQAQSSATAMLAAVLLALTLTAIGFNVQHDGNHGAFSRRRWVNRLGASRSI